MPDYVHMPPVPEALLPLVRHALQGTVVAEAAGLDDSSIAASIDHGIAPLLYHATHADALRETAIRAAAVEPLRTADLNRVLEALDVAGIRPLIMKGTALAYDVYEQPELRPRGDTDLLVSRASFPTVRDVFRRHGAEERLTSGDVHGVRQATFIRRSAYGFEHAYDVHWAVTNTPVFASVLEYDEVAARAIPLPGIGPLAFGFSHVDALILACIHRVAHHHDSERLVWLCDIALLRERMSRDEHQRFWRRAFEREVVAVCERSIALADAWFGRHDEEGNVDRWLSAEERNRPEASRSFLERDLTYGSVMWANFEALPWRARLQRFWQLAFPPAAFMRQSFGVRSGFAFPWFYALRMVRGVARLFRRIGR